MNIKNNIRKIIESLPPGCHLIAVSKTQPLARIREAYDAGQRAFGENKVQELVEKSGELPRDIEWHMVGHLQRNKIKNIVGFVHLIHSVDSIRLLEEINRQGEKIARVVPCLLQIHIAREETKFGFDEEEVVDLMHMAEWSKWQFVSIRGLMGMATFTDDLSIVRGEFKKLKKLFDTLSKIPLPGQVTMSELSMGMSSDYLVAAEEGSTLVRIGTSIFGERNA